MSPRRTTQETARSVRRSRTTRGQEPESGRRIYQMLQRSRQGTPSHEGRTEPRPLRRETVQEEPTKRKGGLRRFAWIAGGLTAVGAGIWMMRRRARNPGMRRYE